jgi:2,4-dienoyl-CoA reductase-like NADH-dependent reductase (Old Yellow Enzyme family)/thioredoxin reductase
MNEFRYKALFEPIRLGNVLFRNRIFAAPTGYQDLSKEGYLPAEAAYYYGRKARGGAASVAVGECVVDSGFGKGAQYHICLDDPFARNGLCKVTHAVSRQGAVATAELQHSGMYANRMQAPPGVAYGPVDYDDHGRIVRAMTEEFIDYTIGMYAKAARFAKDCGFGMVTIHAGHGWLLSQFLSPALNNRRDKWGGAPIENRARLAVSICDAVRKAVGPAFPIEIRISGSECYEGGYDIEEGIAFARQLDGHADLIHVSAGSHEVEEVFTVTHPSMFLPEGVNVRFAAEIKKHIKTPVATVGALADPELMEEIIATGKADVVEIARGLLADPDIPLKARSGHASEIRKCLRCLACFSTLMQCGQFYCAINPESGREMELSVDLPPEKKRRVLIVGGGVAGMQAALTSARRGHEVILCEKSGRLGGALRCEGKVPFKKRLADYLTQQAEAVYNAGVEVRLNTTVTPEYAESIGADVLLAAVGAKPLIPEIPGIKGGNVHSAEEAFNNPDCVGKRVVVIGAGLVGVELGIYLATLGRAVEIVEIADKINDGGNFQHGKSLTVEIKKYNIGMHFETRVQHIDMKGVSCVSAHGESYLEADTVIYAVGQRPLQDEGMSFRFCAPEFYQLGDCITPANIMNATAAAFTIATNIGR